MNQVFAGGIGLIIAFILWSSNKKSLRSTFIKSEKKVLGNNNETTSFVQTKQLINPTEVKSLDNLKSKPFLNQPLLNSIATNKKLTKLISSNPSDRFLAIQIASQMKSKKALPFLRRGLKDSDRKVVIASAAAISFYKGKTFNLRNKSQIARPPRNVSRMR